MLATKISKNQIALPKAVVEFPPDVNNFDIIEEVGRTRRRC
jgi:hypothetical protein